MSLDTYCNSTSILQKYLNAANFSEPVFDENGTLIHDNAEDDYENNEDGEVFRQEPNTALLSFILMFCTFFIAYFLRIFRIGKYLGRTVSKLSIVQFVLMRKCFKI